MAKVMIEHTMIGTISQLPATMIFKMPFTIFVIPFKPVA
jgi:hypothetical protein